MYTCILHRRDMFLNWLSFSLFNVLFIVQCLTCTACFGTSVYALFFCCRMQSIRMYLFCLCLMTSQVQCSICQKKSSVGVISAQMAETWGQQGQERGGILGERGMSTTLHQLGGSWWSTVSSPCGVWANLWPTSFVHFIAQKTRINVWFTTEANPPADHNFPSPVRGSSWTSGGLKLPNPAWQIEHWSGSLCECILHEWLWIAYA